MNYKNLMEVLKSDITAVEIRRRIEEADKRFASAVKEYGSAQEARAYTESEKESQSYCARLEGYAMAIAGNLGFDIWNDSFAAVAEWMDEEAV
jgi:hypothetical protein